MRGRGGSGLGILSRGNFVGVDQGADFTGRGPVPVLDEAEVTDVGSASILEGGSWPYVIVRLLSGPRRGKYEYIAENVRPSVQVGQHLNPGDTAALARGAYPYIEAGWNRGPRGWDPEAPLEPNPHAAKPAGRDFWAYVQGKLRGGSDAVSHITLEGLWLHAGGPPNVARTMAAIALAESGGRVNAVGGPNDDGSHDYGLWQINSSHAAYSKRRLLSDASYNARAAVSIFRTQGLGAWTTYSSGAYKAFLAEAPTATPAGRPPRPPADSGGGAGSGGGSSSSSSSSSADAAAAADAQAAAWGSYLAEGAAPQVSQVQPVIFGIPHTGWVPSLPSIPNPLSLFGEASSAVSDVGTFLKWVAWLFSPRNILRIVEFVTGAGLLAVAVYFAGRGLERSSSSSSSGPTGAKKATIKRAVRATPPGRAVALAQAGREGRQAGRRARAAATSATHRDEEKRTRKRAQKREEARRAPGESRRRARARAATEKREGIPF